ncbi:hypothetical protein ACXR8F_04410 [Terrabacter sp. AAH1]
MAIGAEAVVDDRDSSAVPWADLTLKEVLRLQGLVVAELRDREVIRTRNVVGEMAETIVARAYGGELGHPSQAGWDVRAGKRKLQVKCRVVEEGEKRAKQFTPFAVDEDEADTADAFVFAIFDSASYEVVWAREVPRDDVVAMSHTVPRSHKRRVNVRQIESCARGIDVTESLRGAFAEIDTPRARQ